MAWVLVILCLGAGPEGAAGGAPVGWSAGEVEDLLEQVAQGARFPVGTSFRQAVTLRALFATWRFESFVRQEPDGLRSETKGAPSFVPDTLPGDLVGLVQSLDLFELSVVEAEDPAVVVFRGPRIGYNGTGPKEATFWIDLERRIVQRAEAVYSWGTLSVSQEYLDRDGRWLLARQRARATPFGLTLDVNYLDYQIP